MVGRIGRYDIVGKLGVGGFGSVYKGYDSTVGRVVAIKVLSSQNDPDMLTRFRAEAMTAGNLNHRNVVTIYEFGEDNGAPFLAMEYLDGVDLHKIISDKNARESLSLVDKLGIMAEAAQGLQCAHEHGVIHRDVKPANIMRLKDGTVKIMDFGIARLTGVDATRLTQTGLMIGTVAYMAPEQFRTGDIDALCDIWAYGVVFYELLTGVHPFRSDDPARAMYRIMTEEPPPLRNLVPDCPPAIEENLLRLLAKKREDRVQSLEDFQLDMEPLVRELAQSEIPELLRRAESLIAADQLEDAQAGIYRILKLDRSNAEARKLRERLREGSRQKAARPKIEALLRDAAEDAVNRNYPSALEKLNSALLLDPGSPSVLSQLERLQQDAERARISEEALALGRRALQQQDLSGAFSHLAHALESDPEHKEAAALLDEVRNAMRERERRAQTRSLLEEANRLILIESWDEAIAILTNLRKKDQDPQIARRLVEAQQLKQAQEARDRLSAGIGSAKDMLRHGDYEQGCRLLTELERDHPKDPEVQKLLLHARERLSAAKVATEVERLLSQAVAQKAEGHFDNALDLIRRSLDLDNTSAKALALQGEYLAEARTVHPPNTTNSGLATQLFQPEWASGAPPAFVATPDPARSAARTPAVPVVAAPVTAQPAVAAPVIQRTSRTMLWAGLVGASIAVLGAAAVFWPKPAKVADIRISPETLSFAWQRGNAVPPPLSLHVEAGNAAQRWTAASGDPWLIFTKPTGSGTSDVPASVDPARLAAGDYTTIATFTTPSGLQKITVNLKVTDPPPVPAPPVVAAVAPLEPSGKTAPSQKTVSPDKGKPADTAKSDKTAKKTSPPLESKVNTPPKATEPAPPPIDCHDLSVYHGLSHSSLHWSDGEIPPGGKLTITGKKGSTGSVSGSALPGCEVTLRIDPEGAFEIDPPSAANGFRMLRITNRSGQPIRSVQIDWAIR